MIVLSYLLFVNSIAHASECENFNSPKRDLSGVRLLSVNYNLKKSKHISKEIGFSEQKCVMLFFSKVMHKEYALKLNCCINMTQHFYTNTSISQPDGGKKTKNNSTESNHFSQT